MEQYSSGHADLLNRTRNLQFRLDQILGKQGSKAKDVYASKISLASRVVKIERQVDDIETKMDQLIDLYMEDRKRLLMLPVNNEISAQITAGGDTNTNVRSGTPPVTSSQTPQLVPKPILVDKMSSEPNTPTTKAFTERRTGMSRGGSDGHRIKKRVTLSSIPSQCVAISPSEEVPARSGKSDVVIVVPASNGTSMAQTVVVPASNGAQTVVAIDSDIEQDQQNNESSEYLLKSWSSELQSWDSNATEESFLIKHNIDEVPDFKLKIEADTDASDESERILNVGEVLTAEPDGAMLLTRAAGTEIIVTPISRASSIADLSQDNMANTEMLDFNLLCPDMEAGN